MKVDNYMNASASPYTDWLNEYSSETARFLADTYIFSMQKDLSEIESRLADKQFILQILHRIKGGLAMINFLYLSEMVKSVESSGKMGRQSFEKELNVLITEIKTSLLLVKCWIENQ